MKSLKIKNNSNKIIKFFILFLVLGFYFVNLSGVNAQQEYQLLAPLPCVGGDCNVAAEQTTLEKYLPGMFQLLIGLSAVFAVVMIVWGGFQYITTDALQGKSEGKQRIQNAVFGLVLVVGAWVILNTVNPKLLNVNLNIETADIKAPAGGDGGGLTASGLRLVTQAAIDDLKSQCTDCVSITSTTGGSHDPNSLHYQGLAIDIAPNSKLNQFVTGSTNSPQPCASVDKILGGKKTTFLWEPEGHKCGGKIPSSGDHWHMSVTP